VSQLQIGYRISPVERLPTRYHARLPEAPTTLCGISATMPGVGAKARRRGWWHGGTISVKVAMKTLTSPHRLGCKTCIKIAPKYDDVVTRLGRLAR